MNRLHLLQAVLGGVILGCCISCSYLLYFSPVFVGLGFISLRKRLKFLTHLFWGLLGISLGSWYCWQWRATHYSEPISNKPFTFTGIVTKPPTFKADSQTLTILPTGPKHPILKGDSSGKILVRTERYPEYDYGDYVEVIGKLEKPEAFDDFNYPLYLERFGVYAISTRPAIKVLEKEVGNPFLHRLYGARTNLEKTISESLPEPESSLLSGILLGSNQTIPTSIQDQLQITGTSHIVAISGANITLVLGLAIAALPLYTLKGQFLVTVLSALSLVYMTGASSSVVRGALIATLSAYARARSRQGLPLTVLFLGMILMLLGNPLLIQADIGFQLSYAAFAGILFFSPWLTAKFNNLWLSSWWPEIFRSSMAQTIAASLGTAPIILFHFKQLSLIGLIANPAILWLLPFITPLGLLALFLHFIPGFILITRFPLWLLLHAMLSIIAFFSRFSVGLLTLPTYDP